MIGRGMVVRRRPLLRTAAIGGAGYMAGRSAANRSAAEDDQNERIGAMEQQQYAQPAAPAGAPGASAADQLSQLSTLHQQGALSDEEFAAAKAKILGA